CSADEQHGEEHADNRKGADNRRAGRLATLGRCAVLEGVAMHALDCTTMPRLEATVMPGAGNPCRPLPAKLAGVSAAYRHKRRAPRRLRWLAWKLRPDHADRPTPGAPR